MIVLPSLIITPRLKLWPLEPRHAAALAQATDESWQELHRWMTWATDRAEAIDPAASATYAARSIEAYQRGEDFVFCGCLPDGDFVLSARLNPKYMTDSEMRFGGVWINRRHAGKGLATEAVNALTRFSFNKLGAKRVEYSFAPDNEKSRAVATRLGFEEIGKNAGEVICMRYGADKLPAMPLRYRYLMRAPTPARSSSTDTQIRPIHANDRPALGRLIYDAYRGTVDDEGGDVAASHKEIQEIFEGREGPVDLQASFCAEAGTGIAAATLVTQHPRLGTFLSYVMTHPDHQGRGLAHHVINRSLNALHAAGRPELHLVVTGGNIPAERLYQKIGFTYMYSLPDFEKRETGR